MGFKSKKKKKHTKHIYKQNENENIIRMVYSCHRAWNQNKTRQKKINKIFVQIEMVIIVYYYCSSLPYMQMYWK